MRPVCQRGVLASLCLKPAECTGRVRALTKGGRCMGAGVHFGLAEIMLLQLQVFCTLQRLYKVNGIAADSA